MPLALRPLNTQYNARALWVHLDDGSGEPLCGERKKGWSLVPELVDADYPHVCEPCAELARAALLMRTPTVDEQRDLLDTATETVL